jgi:hypothetical protein
MSYLYRESLGFVLYIGVAPWINKLVRGNGPQKREGKWVGWWAARRGKRRVMERVGQLAALERKRRRRRGNGPQKRAHQRLQTLKPFVFYKFEFEMNSN